MTEKKTTKAPAVANEATGDTATFTVEIKGEQHTFEDKFDKDGLPGAMMFLGSKDRTKLAQYVPVILEEILGEDQIFKMFEHGATVEDMAAVIPAWQEARGLTKS